jgi:hypothetical protein
MKIYNDDTTEEKTEEDVRAQKIANLWMEMQKYGLPPAELTGNLHSDETSSGLMKGGGNLENECSIM